MRGINLDDFGNTIDNGSYFTTIQNSRNIVGGNLNGFFNASDGISNITITDNNIGTYAVSDIPTVKSKTKKKKI